MRIGISNKKTKAGPKKAVLQTTEAQQKAAATKVGEGMSGNVVATMFAPKITDVSTQQAEKYAEELLAYEDATRTFSNESIVDDENLDSSDVPPEPNINSYLFGSVEAREEILAILSETSGHFTTVKKGGDPKWKVHANAAKFERLLDEKYGPFRPFISQHPEIEVFIRNTQRKYSRGEFSPLRKDGGPIDKKTSIMLLFMMHRQGVKIENMALAVLFFLVGLQPWALIMAVILGHQMFEGRKKKKVAGWFADEVKTVKSYYANATNDKAKHDILRNPVGAPIADGDFKEKEEEGEEKYDTVFVGSGPSTLFTAALLSRTGRTVLVVSPENDASGCHSVGQMGGVSKQTREKYSDVPFDIDSNNVAHTSRQQRLLAPALCSETDAQGGIRFSRIGTQADGFVSDILLIPGMGVDGRNDTHPFLLQAGGVTNIAIEAATFLGDGLPDEDGVGSSTSAGYLNACAGINATASEFYTSKLMKDQVNKMTKDSSYQEASVRYSSAFLDQVLPLNAHVRSLMAGIGMKGENLPPSKTSMAAHVTNICSQASEEGFTYPVGGPRALCHALASVIEQNGGKVVTGAKIKEFIFEKDANAKEEEKDTKSKDKPAQGGDPNKPRCVGVQLADGRTISVGADKDSCVVSMLGFIPTFIFHMSDDIRSRYGIPAGLPSLAERRPLLKILVGLRGTSEELSLTGADWYRLPNASIALDEKDEVTGQVKPGLIGAQIIDREESEEKNEEAESSEGTRGKRNKTASVPKKAKPVKFNGGSSWMKISFPSAKDPSWKERYSDISTCVVTVEADDDFVQMFDSSPKLFINKKPSSSECSRFIEKVEKELLNNFPQLEDKIDFCSMTGPLRKGLSQTPLRYAAKGVRPESPYPGLFMGGSDITVGDSFSGAMVGGWMAANAIINYSFIDHLYLEKNVTNDLSRFMKSPKHSGEDDVAVPFQQIAVEKLVPDDEEEDDEIQMPSAEYSKEE
eukprot:CAMPEP_0194121996 /NCGR_PEP_ID=MMETSP0150-20130528/48912_1 /TAXON_ID=122233 /ORGANISM="Chaetoceros debilis, Strain MM31A-1" /LENGTH=972 /DNA_ID=CAMNT_0038814659 /DNA_START=133 /DNA_END=3051 /DNA_ORIENTATION=-